MSRDPSAGGCELVSRLPLPTIRQLTESVATRRSVEGRYIFNGPDEEIFDPGPYFYSASDLILGVASDPSAGGECATCRSVGVVSVLTEPTKPLFIKKVEKRLL